MKRLLSIFLAIVLTLSSLTVATGAFADDVKTAKIKLTGVAGGAFIVQPYDAEVAANLSKRYDVGFDDNSDEPTMLDAAIALHLAVFGSNFLTDAPLSLNEQGWIQDFMGMGGAVGYWNNNVMSGAITDTIKDGDFAYFGLYQDTASWSDQYVFADSLEKTINIGEQAEITFSVSGWSGNTPAANYTVTVDGNDYGTTDSNGKIKIPVDFLEKKVVSLKASAGSYIFPAYCELYGDSKLLNYVLEELDAGVKYTFPNKSSLDLKDTLTLADYVLAEYDVGDYIPDFVQLVKDNLAANSGKLISPYSNKEDAALYGAAIIIFNAYDENTSDLTAAFSAIDYENAKPSSPYHYRFAVAGALYADDIELAKTIAQDLIDSNYTMGKGMFLGSKDNPFYNCDNTAYFIMTLFPFRTILPGDIYKDYIDDALNVLKKYIKPNGAFCDLPAADGSAMSPDVNADSTALAMGAYAALGDFDNAFKLYKNLVEGFESKTGIFTFGGQDSALSTMDAVRGLSLFGGLVADGAKEHPEHVVKTVTVPATTTAAGSVTKTCVIDGKVVSKTVIPKKTTPAKAKDTIKLTLKKVTVKKSAKKLVLKATLKINGKAVKGKKITFKFKGKKYNAKTNKKGVAKVTIKKSVLKKLKAGKKITYSATYGKSTAKKTVKVKK
ncbi:MAG: hypothetical protein IJT65_03055 [Eubacterium sp.]|nr:hypothetical protein [Eubacterium sp.]